MYKQLGQKQKGMTFIGLVLIIAMIVFAATIAIKLYPPYLEFFTVKKAIAKIANDPAFPTMTPKLIRESFGRTASIDNIRVIASSDLAIGQGNGKPLVTAEYQVVVPIMGNLSALLDFAASSDPDAPAPDDPVNATE